MAQRRRKPRRKNAGKVISLAAFRKKKAQGEAAEEPHGPEGRRFRRGTLRDLLGPQEGPPPTPEEIEERMADFRDAMQVKQRLQRLLKVTQRAFSPSTVKRYLPIVARYDADTLRSFAFESTEKQWLEKPSFFRAVMREAADRWGMFEPSDNPEEPAMAKKKATKKKSRKKAPKRRRPSKRETEAKQAEVRRLFPDETGDIFASWIGLEQENPSKSVHRDDAVEYMGDALEKASEGERLEASRRRHEAYIVYQEARDDALRAMSEIRHTGDSGRLRERDLDAMQIVVRHAEAGMQRTCGPKGNPNTTEHRQNAAKLARAAGQALESAQTSEERGRPWQEEFDSYLNALVWAMAAHREAEYGMPKRKEGRRQRRGARRMAWAVEDTERHVLKIADTALRGLRQMVVTARNEGRGEAALAAANPANIPGGDMTECIAIMEARGDVESPGALCNWLSQKAGERRGSARGARRSGRRKKVSDALRRAMRGT